MAATDVGSKAWFQLLLWPFAVASIRHIISVNTQTRLSMHAVLPEPSLLSHINKMGVYMASFISQCTDNLSMPVPSPEPSLLSQMHKMGVHKAYSFSQCSDAH